MHTAAKVFLGLGLLFTLAGVGLTFVGGSSLSDAEDWDVEEKSDFSGTAGVTTYSFSENVELDFSGLIVMVSDDVRCDEFTFTMTNESGEDHVIIDCEDDGEKPRGWEDDPDGWYHMATIYTNNYSAGEYTIESNEDYHLVPLSQLYQEVIVGLFGVFGGISTACGGICFLLLGGIFALVLRDPKETQITGSSSALPSNNDSDS